MSVRTDLHGGVLKLEVACKALIERPDWERLAGLNESAAPVVALDLKDAQFVSSAFLQGCVDLNRALACDGRQLVLLNLSAHHRRVLEITRGAAELLVLDCEERLHSLLPSLLATCALVEVEQGVTDAEKHALWS